MNIFKISAYTINMKKENIVKYGNPVLFVALVAILGSIFTNMGLDWLKELNKPTNWLATYIIPIVWTIIYSSFTAYFIYLTKNNKWKKTLIYLLTLNGMLNVIWCLIFFASHMILLGLIVIIINLLYSILLNIEIIKSNKKWGYYLLIYPTWLTIATFLNLSLWILN